MFLKFKFRFIRLNNKSKIIGKKKKIFFRCFLDNMLIVFINKMIKDEYIFFKIEVKYLIYLGVYINWNDSY